MLISVVKENDASYAAALYIARTGGAVGGDYYRNPVLQQLEVQQGFITDFFREAAAMNKQGTSFAAPIAAQQNYRPAAMLKQRSGKK